jgi:hypothetical protein
MRVGGKMAIDATKPPLWRKKERAQFERVQPSGIGDPALESILEVLRQETVKGEKLQPVAT